MRLCHGFVKSKPNSIRPTPSGWTPRTQASQLHESAWECLSHEYPAGLDRMPNKEQGGKKMHKWTQSGAPLLFPVWKLVPLYWRIGLGCAASRGHFFAGFFLSLVGSLAKGRRVAYGTRSRVCWAALVLEGPARPSAERPLASWPLGSCGKAVHALVRPCCCMAAAAAAAHRHTICHASVTAHLELISILGTPVISFSF